MREAVVENAVCEWAEKNGWLVRKMAYAGRRGCPDRMFVKRGRIVLAEFKRPGGTLDGHQVREHRRLKEHGYRVPVIDTIEDGIALLGGAVIGGA